MTGALLEVDGLAVTLRGDVHPVTSVDLTVEAGEMVGIVGESGSGKSMSLRAITGLLPLGVRAEVRGAARLDGEDLLALPPKQARARCARAIGFVFQDPLSSLNPGFRIGWQLDEALRHRVPDMDRAARRARAIECLERVELPAPDQLLRSYPHELSGGMRQRVMIAMALLSRPRLLLADEPTTALDVTLSAEILDLVGRLQRDEGLATILVSHDLNLVAARCDRVIVMYAGRVVETASAAQVFTAPRHPYTRGLLAATVDPFRAYETSVDPIRGEGIGAHDRPACPFAPRCELRIDVCDREAPPLEAQVPGHAAACHRQHEVAGDETWDASIGQGRP